MKKRILSILIAVAMIVSLLPMTALAKGGSSVDYVDAAGTPQQSGTSTYVLDSDTEWSGWMYAASDTTINNLVELKADTNLILKDGVTLTVNGGITGEYDLTIYGQTAQTGKLVVVGAVGAKGTDGTSGGQGGQGVNAIECKGYAQYGGIVEATGGQGGQGGNASLKFGSAGAGGHGGTGVVCEAFLTAAGKLTATGGAVGEFGSGTHGTNGTSGTGINCSNGAGTVDVTGGIVTSVRGSGSTVSYSSVLGTIPESCIVMTGTDEASAVLWDHQAGTLENYICITAAATSAKYDEVGEGTESAPWEISTLAQLNDLAAAVNGTGDYTDNADDMSDKYFKLTADIGTTEKPFTTPIGAKDTPFSGTFDGDGYTVTLDVNTSGNSIFAGLFGYSDGVIKNVTTAGSVSTTCVNNDIYIGGVCGLLGWEDNLNGNILNCHNSADISVTSVGPEGIYYVGGICGEDYGCISNCYNSGSISCSITSDDMVALGGMCGSSYAGVIENCYSSGEVTASGSENIYIGGVCGYGGTNKACYYDKSLYTAEDNTTGVIGLVTDQMQTAAGETYTGGGKVLDGKSLVDLLNSYTEGEPAAYPSDWLDWEVKNGEYPTFKVGFQPEVEHFDKLEPYFAYWLDETNEVALNLTCITFQNNILGSIRDLNSDDFNSIDDLWPQYDENTEKVLIPGYDVELDTTTHPETLKLVSWEDSTTYTFTKQADKSFSTAPTIELQDFTAEKQLDTSWKLTFNGTLGEGEKWAYMPIPVAGASFINGVFLEMKDILGMDARLYGSRSGIEEYMSKMAGYGIPSGFTTEGTVTISSLDGFPYGGLAALFVAKVTDNDFVDIYGHKNMAITVGGAILPAGATVAENEMDLHDLIVTKSGGAIKGTADSHEDADYYWDDTENELNIIKDGLTVSGTTTKENIDVWADTVTFKNLSVAVADEFPLNIGSGYNLEIIVKGTNLIQSVVGTYSLSTVIWHDNLTISGDGDLTLKAGSDKESATCLFSADSDTGSLTISATGNITIDSSWLGISCKNLTVAPTAGKILVYGAHPAAGAIVTTAGISLGGGVAVKASANENAAEASITETGTVGEELEDDVTYYYIKTASGSTAKSVVIKQEELTPWQELQNAINAADDNSETTITLTQNVTAAAEDSPLSIPAAKKIVLELNGFALTTPEKNDGFWNEGSLVIQDSSVGNTGTVNGANAPHTGIYNYKTGSAELKSGTITGYKSSAVNTTENASFTMSGGTIKDCYSPNYGGAVKNKGAFTMTDGTIQNCESNGHGGAIYSEFATAVTISGGTIDSCKAAANGGAIFVQSGKVTVNSATIKKCTATANGGAIFIGSGAEVELKSGTLDGNKALVGGGVSIGAGGKLTMSGGTVKNNEADTTQGGGGIWACGTFDLKAGEISGNKAKSGAGVYVSYANSTESDADTVFFTMTGGEIKGNIASDKGGGVYVDNYDIGMKMTAGEISGNTAGNIGGGVCCNTAITLGGTVKVKSNTSGAVGSKVTDNVYLRTTGKSAYSPVVNISTESALTSGADIGVSSDAAVPVTISGTCSDVAQYFKADKAGQGVVFKTNHLELCEVPTFKAVYDTTGGANTLTFYYDAVDHSGANITVYDDLPAAATGSSQWGYDSIRSNVKSVEIDSSVANYHGLTSTADMFYNMQNAESIRGAEYLDVSGVTTMKRMFYCFGYKSTALTAVPDVSKWNTSNVTDMTSLFNSYGYNSTGLNAVPDVSKWNTSNVTDMTSLFNSYGYNSTALNVVPDVSKWNTSNVTKMSSTFRSYGKGKSAALNAVPDVSGWNTAKVTTFYNLFSGYGAASTALSTVPDVSGWNTAKVTDMGSMFNSYGAASKNLDFTLDLSGWSVESVDNSLGDYYENVFADAAKAAGKDGGTGKWSVTIPAVTALSAGGTIANETTKWYLSDGTTYISPAADRSFNLASSAITFDMQGGAGGSNSVTATYGEAMPNATMPTKAGYTFDGYFDAESGGTKYYNADGTSAKNWDKTDVAVTLYAQWTEKTATLTYNANGHGTAPDSVTMKYTEATNAAAALTATGYTFTGWNTKADGTGTAYAAGAEVKAANTEPTAMTLYAQWTEVHHSSSGGSSAPAITVPVTGDDNSVKVSASVSGSTATVQNIKDADLDKVTGGETVEIDLTGLKKDIDTAKISTETVEKIGEQAGMSVKLSTATVEFDKTATQEIVKQADGNMIELVVDDIKEVSLNAVQKEAVGKLDTALIIDAYLVSNGVRLCSESKGGFGGGKATVALPYEIKNNRTAANYSVYYVDDAGKLEKLAAKYDAELGAFVFEIEHFSNYVVAYDENGMSFADVPETAYYYNAVLWAAANGITQGTDAVHFSPNAPVTRAQVVTFLWRAAGKPVVNYAMNMSDVKSGEYYSEAVRWALSEGITKGTSDTMFSPDAVCTRGQIVTFLARFAGVKDEATGYTHGFTDVEATDYFNNAVAWAKDNKVTEGTSATTFSPNTNCTRAQVVTFLWRWMVK